MRLGPDGMLYVGVGAYDPPEAQNPDTLAGKLLRMDLAWRDPPGQPRPEQLYLRERHPQHPGLRLVRRPTHCAGGPWSLRR